MDIEKGIPPPMHGRGRRTIYDFAAMEINDSVLIENASKYVSARNAAHNYGSRTGTSFTTQVTDKGLRIWRIK